MGRQEIFGRSRFALQSVVERPESLLQQPQGYVQAEPVAHDLLCRVRGGSHGRRPAGARKERRRPRVRGRRRGEELRARQPQRQDRRQLRFGRTASRRGGQGVDGRRDVRSRAEKQRVDDGPCARFEDGSRLGGHSSHRAALYAGGAGRQPADDAAQRRRFRTDRP